jgi:ParB/RepB/Spo0J family partition protein
MRIPLSDIQVVWHDNNSRSDFHQEEWRKDCAPLADTIEQVGLLQPVGVVKIDHPEFKYKLCFGYRRMFATKHILGYDSIEAVVLQREADANPIENVIENLSRKDLSYWDACMALRKTFGEQKLTHRQVAKQIGQPEGWTYARWRVWELSEEIRDQVAAGLLSPSDISILLAKSPPERDAAAIALQEAKQRGETRREIGERLVGRKGVRPKKDVQRRMSIYMEQNRMDLVHALRWALGEINDTQLDELV